MRAHALVTAALAAAQLTAVPLPAQDADLAELVELARAGTERYRDPSVAAADGFRPFGPEFPTMGQHWVNVARVMAGGLDAARPPILEYATIAGRIELVGVGYATLVEAKEVPSGLAVPPDAWHFHAGTLDEESFVLGHASHGAHAGPRVRIAVLHLWVWDENPDGLTATHHRGLSFRRLGLTVPAAAPPAPAAHGVALAAGAAPYYTAYARARGVRDDTLLAHVEAALDAGAARINAALEAAAAGELSTELAALAADEWRRVWDEVERRTSREVRRAAEPPE